MLKTNRPIILNIARGYYGDHSVTVCGYEVWQINGKEHHFVAVYDGWKRGIRYIDFEVLSYDWKYLFASFNTVNVGEYTAPSYK